MNKKSIITILARPRHSGGAGANQMPRRRYIRDRHVGRRKNANTRCSRIANPAEQQFGDTSYTWHLTA